MKNLFFFMPFLLIGPVMLLRFRSPTSMQLWNILEKQCVIEKPLLIRLYDQLEAWTDHQLDSVIFIPSEIKCSNACCSIHTVLYECDSTKLQIWAKDVTAVPAVWPHSCKPSGIDCLIDDYCSGAAISETFSPVVLLIDFKHGCPSGITKLKY